MTSQNPSVRVPQPGEGDFTPGAYLPTGIEGVYVFYPRIHGDSRGSFHEWFKADAFAEALGYPFIPEQANMSVSAAGVVRGIHLAEVPPGQAKLVTCPAGRATDIVVDLRRDSDTYLQHLTIPIGGDTRAVVYLPVGVGHGFVAHEDNTVVSYLTSTGYDPDAEFGINISDDDLEIDLPRILDGVAPVVSDKDKAAPSLKDVRDRLATIDECREWESGLKDGWALANEEAGE